MIRMSKYSIFSEQDAYKVNTVNNEGVMGKGIALETKIRFPETYKFYKDNYESKKGGDILFDKQNKFIHFFTKESWKNDSKIEWIVKGLNNLKDLIISQNIKKIALPLLGASNGHLDASEVIKLIKLILSNLDCEVIICQALENDPLEEKALNEIKEGINKKASALKSILNEDQIHNLVIAFKNKAIKLFRDLLNIKSIGEAAYKKILNLFILENNNQEQLTLL